MKEEALPVLLQLFLHRNTTGTFEGFSNEFVFLQNDRTLFKMLNPICVPRLVTERTAGPAQDWADWPFKTHRRGTSWPDCGEDSLQRIEKLELLRDRRTPRSTKPETCGTHGTHQRDAHPLWRTSCWTAAACRSYTCAGSADRQLLMSVSST